MPHADEEPNDGNDDGDSNGSKDNGESLVEGEPPAKKGRLDEPGKNRHPLISKLTKALQLTEHVGPAIDGDLASLVDKICLLYTSPSPRDQRGSRMPSSA